MKFSASGIKALQLSEGNILTAYQDGGGVWTIGTGHTSAAGLPKVYKGLKITAQESADILAKDLIDVEKQVNDAVKVPLNQNQFDALGNLVYNIGPTAFNNSTLLRKLNAKDYQGAANQFLVWNKDNGKTIQGLIDRRLRERTMFLSTTLITEPQKPTVIVPETPTIDTPSVEKSSLWSLILKLIGMFLK